MRYIVVTIAAALCVLLLVLPSSPSSMSAAPRETFTPAPPTATFAPYPAPDAPPRHHPSAAPSGIQRTASCSTVPARLRSACAGVR